jgi:hypothetical protein
MMKLQTTASPARLYRLDVGWDCLDYPCNLMAQDTGQRECDLALHDMQVGMAHATGRHFYQDLARSGLRRGDLFDDERATHIR